MGCASSTSASGPKEAWACQYCSQQFGTYQAAENHERYCPRRPGAPPAAYSAPPVSQAGPVVQGKVSQAPTAPVLLSCGSCKTVFQAPAGYAQCKCPKCGTVNAIPKQHQQAQQQPNQQATIPQQVYNQHTGLTNAPVVNQPGPAPTGRKRALLVGINYYGTKAELRGCINDVKRMQEMITNMYGFDPREIRVLTDDARQPSQQPTRRNMLDGFRWLVEGVQPGDCLFFHYSGHGAQQQDPSFSEEDGYDETVCPVDFNTAGMIVDDEIFDLMVAPLPSGAKLTAVMDCCHSGTGLDLPFTWERTRWVCDDNPCHSAGDILLISGCQDDQTSSDGGGWYGRPAGAMTTALCNTLERMPVLSLPQLLDGLRAELRNGRYSQLPQLTASQSVDARERMFSLTDGIVGNTNPMLGRQFNKKKHPKRPNLLHGGLGTMLAAGAVGFIAADVALSAAPAMVMGGLALGTAAVDAGGAVGEGIFGGAADLLGGAGDLLGGALGGMGDFGGGLFD